MESEKVTISEKPDVRLVNVNVADQNVALNLMISFLSVAQKRGVFGLDESAKIWECIKMFEIPLSAPTGVPPTGVPPTGVPPTGVPPTTESA
jgi:hypothetical protein